jgi:hypothetical protein
MNRHKGFRVITSSSGASIRKTLCYCGVGASFRETQCSISSTARVKQGLEKNADSCLCISVPNGLSTYGNVFAFLTTHSLTPLPLFTCFLLIFVSLILLLLNYLMCTPSFSCFFVFCLSILKVILFYIFSPRFR